jgi:hypothetical protein
LYDGQFPCPSETLFVRQFLPPPLPPPSAYHGAVD